MSLLDVDLDAPRRIEGITAEGLRALNEVRQRAEDVDKAVDEMFERQDRARQELDDQVKRAAAQRETTEEKAHDEDRPKPRRTLSLGGEEFHQARETRQAEAPKPAVPPPAEPVPAAEPARPGRTLKLGARDDAAEEAPRPGNTLKPRARDDDEPQPDDRPARRPRPPRADGDDDQSGRTWLR